MEGSYETDLDSLEESHPSHNNISRTLQRDIIKKLCNIDLSYEQCCDICEIIENPKIVDTCSYTDVYKREYTFKY
jgi:nitrate reductase beta subunit